MTEENYRILLVKKITQNRLNPQEVSLLKKYKEVFDEEGEMEENLLLAWNFSSDTNKTGDATRIANKVLDRIYLETQNNTRTNGLFTKIAASIVLLVGFCVYFLNTDYSETEWINYTAQTGKLSTLTLSDGSKVMAKPGTIIMYPEEFTSQKREIKMLGTAHFKVKEDPDRPFVVTSGSTTTTVLGTSFSVSYDSLVEFSRVAVLEGKVLVETDIQSTLLTDLEAIEISLKDHTTKINKLGNQNDFEWTQGIFSYQDTPIPKILDELSQWYGVKIESNKLENCVFTGRFQTENLQIILVNLAESNRLKINKKANKHYQVTGKGC